MKRAALTLLLLTLAASVAGTPGEAVPQKGGGYHESGLHGGSVTLPAVPRGASLVTSTPAPSGGASTSRTGRASWYAANGNIAAVPWWSFGDEPVWATVTHFRDGQAFSVTVLIQDFCQCYVGTGRERLIDLSDDAFQQLAPLGRGVISVTLETPAAAPRLPATSTEDVP